MDFNQAQASARQGKKIRRAEWPETQAASLSGGALEVIDERGFSAPFYPTAEDRKATDWDVADVAKMNAATAAKNAKAQVEAAERNVEAAKLKLQEAEAALAEAKKAAEAPPPPPPPPAEPQAKAAKK